MDGDLLGGAGRMFAFACGAMISVGLWTVAPLVAR